MRRMRPNLPNRGHTTGSRIFVQGTVNAAKKLLLQHGIAYKKVRAAGPNAVEIIYTQYSRTRTSPASLLSTGVFKPR